MEDVAHEGPPLGVPEFEGKIPVAAITRLNGAGQRIVRPMRLDEKVVLIVEAEVRNVAHVKTAEGVKRIHTLNVEDVYEVEGKLGARLLGHFRRKWREGDVGSPTLPGFDETAGPGEEVTLVEGALPTPGELARLLGEDEVAPELEPVILVFEDGTRGLWPDDWDGLGQSLGGAGSVMRKPHSRKASDTGWVVESLDADTGETIEKVDLDELLGARERRQAAEEAAEDAAVAGAEAGDGWEDPEPLPPVQKTGDELAKKRDKAAG